VGILDPGDGGLPDYDSVVIAAPATGGRGARALVAALGVEGRAFYLNVQHRLDTAYPALLVVVLALAFRLLARGWMAWALTTIAVLAAAFDYLENWAVAVLLRAGPEAITDAMVESASRWTLLKSAAASMAFVALVVLLLRAGWVWVRQRHKFS
jgi:hypothetical protein